MKHKLLMENWRKFTNEAKNKDGKEQGGDGKACWKGKRYAGKDKDGSDICEPMEEARECPKCSVDNPPTDAVCSCNLKEEVIDEKKKKTACKPSKGKRFSKRVKGKCRSYGQA